MIIRSGGKLSDPLPFVKFIINKIMSFSFNKIPLIFILSWFDDLA